MAKSNLRLGLNATNVDKILTSSDYLTLALFKNWR